MQDPEKVRKIEVLSANSLIGLAIRENGLVKARARKDIAYREEIDGIIYKLKKNEREN
jgi:hypothetical protein